MKANMNVVGCFLEDKKTNQKIIIPKLSICVHSDQRADLHTDFLNKLVSAIRYEDTLKPIFDKYIFAISKSHAYIPSQDNDTAQIPFYKDKLKSGQEYALFYQRYKTNMDLYLYDKDAVQEARTIMNYIYGICINHSEMTYYKSDYVCVTDCKDEDVYKTTLIYRIKVFRDTDQVYYPDVTSDTTIKDTISLLNQVLDKPEIYTK